MALLLERTWWLGKYRRFISLPWVKITQITVLAFLVFALFWKGGKGLEATWLLTALAWMCTFTYWAGKPKEDKVSPFIWFFLLAFAGLTILSWFKSTTSNYGFDEMIRTSSLVLIFFWMVRTFLSGGGRDFFNQLVFVVICATLVAGLVGLFVYLFQPVDRYVGTFFDFRFHTDYWPNAWADWLLLTWPLVALWTQKKRLLADSLIRLFAFGLIVGFLLLSYSRGALIAFAGQLMLWAAFIAMRYWRTGAFPWKDTLLKAGVVVSVALVLFVTANGVRSYYFPVQSVGEKVTFTAPEGKSSVSERHQFWEQALVLSFKEPLTGWGPYSFRFIQPRLQEGVRATSDHPHNVFLKIAMERGWIAALILIGVFSVVVLRNINKRIYEWKRQHILFLLLSVSGLMAHSLIDYNLQFVSITLLLWILLAVLAAEIPWRSGVKLNIKFVRFFEVALATTMLVITIIEAQGMILSSFGRHAEAKGEGEKALAWYSVSADQWMSRDTHLSRAKILYDFKRLEEAESAIMDYFDENMHDYRAWKLYADILRSQRRVDEALESYQIACEIGGRYNDFGVVHAWAELLMQANRWGEFESAKNDITRIMKEYVYAIEKNMHFVALTENVEEVIALANTFSEIHNRREAPVFQVLAARADHHSRIEREKAQGRVRGYLW